MGSGLPSIHHFEQEARKDAHKANAITGTARRYVVIQSPRMAGPFPACIQGAGIDSKRGACRGEGRFMVELDEPKVVDRKEDPCR
jgi:hypothetical protein